MSGSMEEQPKVPAAEAPIAATVTPTPPRRPRTYERRAYRLRFWLLFAALACISLGVLWVFGQFNPEDSANTRRWTDSSGPLGTPFTFETDRFLASGYLVFLGLLMLAQWAFL